MAMNFYIKLPPEEEREKMIHTWVNGMLEGSYEDFFSLINDLTDKGFTHNGIMCLFLHDNTTEEVKERIEEESSHVLTEAIFGGPICLN